VSAPKERALEAFDRHEAHPPIDGEGIQLAVDLDCALAEAGIPVGAADGLSRDALARLLDRAAPEHASRGAA
jgi:hypothetical protein